MRAFALLGAAAVAALVPQASSAQDADGPTSFRGFRLEGNVGGDRYGSERVHQHDKLGYGGSGGFDGLIGQKIVIGAEGSYWRPNHGNENCTSSLTGRLCDTSYSEVGAAVRAGYLITPRVLIFGKGGLVRNIQNNVFTPTPGLFIVNGQVTTIAPYTRRTRNDGYQFGGGVELSLTKSFYVDGQYVFSQYDNHTYRQRLMGGVGIRFK